jgi:phosphoglycolate phosphatase-like HAD superfamily hydrolase
MKNLKCAVVFDFDGTLIDSRDVKTSNYVRAFENIFGTTDDARQKVEQSCIKTSGANRFVQLSDTLTILGLTATEKEKEEWSSLYSRLNSRSLRSIPEFPSVKSVLERLDKMGFDLFAASGILEEEFLSELSRRGLMGYFSEAKGGDKLGFLELLKAKGFPFIVFVGDTSYDAKTAADAGVQFYKIEDDRDFLKLPNYLTKAHLRKK